MHMYKNKKVVGGDFFNFLKIETTVPIPTWCKIYLSTIIAEKKIENPCHFSNTKESIRYDCDSFDSSRNTLAAAADDNHELLASSLKI